MNERHLIKTDKNGTKYYHNVCTCGRCGGTGIVSVYVPINGGECFECNGYGYVEYDSKEYTPEYEAKLIARREKAYQKKMEKRKAEAETLNKRIFARFGYNENGKTYAVLGDTYKIKDRLKELGFKWDGVIGWHTDTDTDEFQTVEISWEQEYEYDSCGVAEARWNCEDYGEYVVYNAKKIVDKANEELRRGSEDNVSEYLGEVGDKIEVEVTVKREVECKFKVSSWCTNTSTMFIMEDANGNVVTWKTASLPTIKTDDKSEAINRGDEVLMKWLGTGDKVKLKGTIKELSEYKGVKQTVLTRCKVVE